MMPVFESEWLAEASGGRWTALPTRCIQGVSTDSRTLLPGALYVALRGERFDGHVFTGNAFSAGAAAAMVERNGAVAAPAGGALLEVENTATALSALGAAHRRCLAPLTIGVTGSVGKSTVKEMTAAVLGRAAVTARTRGNWNNEIGLPLSLLGIEPGSRYGVFEAGMNHPGEMSRLSRVLQPDWGIVTSVGPVHLEFFASVEAIAIEKGALLQALPRDGRAFLCIDDAWFDLLHQMAPCPVRTVSCDGNGDLNVWPQLSQRRLEVTERASGETYAFNWPWPGRHNALNAGFALLAGREAGLSWSLLEEGLAAYRPLPMRWEEVQVGDWVIVNDAYNANPFSMRAAIGTFAQRPCAGRRWMVLGDMKELGAGAADAHRRLGEDVAGDGEWAGLLTVGPLAAGIADGALARGFDPQRIWCCTDPQCAAEVLHERLQPGDTVLLKASRGMALEVLVEALVSKQRRNA